MASINLTTELGRDRLKVRKEPYFLKIGKRRFLGFRRTELGGTWIARYTVGVQKTHHAIGKESQYPEYEEALKAALLWFGAATMEEQPLTGYTVGQAIGDYLRELKLRKGEKARVNAAWSAEKWILPSLGKIPVAKLTTKKIKAWRDGMVVDSDDPEKVRRAKDTANRIFTILRAELNSSFRDGVVPSDAAWRRVKPFGNVGRARDVYLTSDQCRALLNACGPDFTALVRTALLTGGRYGELVRRRVADLDLRQGVLHISDGKTGSRDVVLSDAAIAHVIELSRDKLPGALLHHHADGREWAKGHGGYQMRLAVSAANENIARPAERIPATTCFYSLRHTYASMALISGINSQMLAENLGTSVAMIESHYGKFLHDDRRKAFNAVAVP